MARRLASPTRFADEPSERVTSRQVNRVDHGDARGATNVEQRDCFCALGSLNTLDNDPDGPARPDRIDP